MCSKVTIQKPQIILLDVEGTTTSISFVKDCLFAYVRKNIVQYLNDHWNDDELQNDIDLLREQNLIDAKTMDDVPLIANAKNIDDLKKSIVDNVLWQMNADRKTKALKQLQGHVWREGYGDGTIKGHIYDDVPMALNRWKNDFGIKIYIYSSGSVSAQKLIYGHSDHGNLLPFIDGHFDTEIGSKIDSLSYAKIANVLNIAPHHILFLTDVTKESRPAKESGINTLLLVRDGNEPLSEDDKREFQTVSSFLEIDFIHT